MNFAKNSFARDNAKVQQKALKAARPSIFINETLKSANAADGRTTISPAANKERALVYTEYANQEITQPTMKALARPATSMITRNANNSRPMTSLMPNTR